MTQARTPASRDAGFAMYTVIMAMTVVLILSATLANGSVATITGVNKDEVAVRAFQAAEAGAQTALHRLNLIQPTAGQCITTSAQTAQSGSTWCAATPPESIGNGQSFTYQTSLASPTGCTGSSFGSATSERCIVATGAVAGITRRVVARVVASSGAQPFPVAGILGLNGVTLSNNAALSGAVGTNGLLSLSNNASVAGTASLWTNAPNPSLSNNSSIAGGVVRGAQFVASVPNMLHPTTGLDSATSNDNARLLAGASPADSCTGSGACYVNTGASPRTLSFTNNKAVTLGGAVYNFCKINFGNNSSLNIAAGARVIIFLDSPNRPGSGCVSGQGSVTASNNATFSNPSGDPTAFQLIVYGTTAYPTITFDNNLTFRGAIYAPTTNVVFRNNAKIVGGITAKTVLLENNGHSYDNRVANLVFATTLIYFRGAWRQCSSPAQAATAPATGCL